jgi:NADH-quinone oxidoreductase subunit J
LGWNVAALLNLIEPRNPVSIEAWLFYPLSILAVLSALGVIAARNPLHSALYLVCCFFFLSALYVVLGAHLVGILQLIVYAGAIMVLFLFVIMLLALGDRELGKSRITLAKVAAGSAIAVAGGWICKELWGGRVTELARPVSPEFGTAAAVGQKLFAELPLQFEAISLLLLVAIVGAVAVAKGRI